MRRLVPLALLLSLIIQAVLRGRRMYQIGVAGPRGSDTASDTQGFISSFTLLPL